MRVVTGEEIKGERAIFNASWELLKKYYLIEQDASDREWEAFTAEAHRLYEIQTNSSHPNQLGKDMALALLTHINTISKDRKEKRHERHNYR